MTQVMSWRPLMDGAVEQIVSMGYGNEGGWFTQSILKLVLCINAVMI